MVNVPDPYGEGMCLEPLIDKHLVEKGSGSLSAIISVQTPKVSVLVILSIKSIEKWYQYSTPMNSYVHYNS